jgi:hypothetical protein
MQIVKRALLALFPVVFVSFPARADDGAASISVGGIVMKRETRISMQKEVLRISPKSVSVDYEFRNDTNEDITTEVAFPVPSYVMDWAHYSPAQQGFDDFRLTVEGRPAKFDVEVKAKLKGQDVSAILQKYGIDIATFGHVGSDAPRAKDIRRLPSAQRASLVHTGLIDNEAEMDVALWAVEKKYYWRQTFPAHSTVLVSHEYTPVIGFTNSVGNGLRGEDAYSKKEVESLCLEPKLSRSLAVLASDQNNSVPFSYVDFILTTANTWKTPIEDFTLIVERPHEKDASQNIVSFCWDGPVKKIDADYFEAHTSNLIPKKELRMGSSLSVRVASNS